MGDTDERQICVGSIVDVRASGECQIVNQKTNQNRQKLWFSVEIEWMRRKTSDRSGGKTIAPEYKRK